MTKSNRFLDQETNFRGRYSHDVLESLRFAYNPYVKKLSVFIAAGFIGRLLLLSNANLIGFWADSHCGAAVEKAVGLQCRPLPSLLQHLDDHDFLFLLSGVTLVGFALTAMFRIGFSRLSAAAISQFYDEVTLRTSRLPIRFFDTNPVGRIVTRFSSDYGNVFRLFGGPLAEFFAIIFDLICMITLVTLASIWYLPVIVVIGVLNFLVYRANRERLRVERRELSNSRSPSIAHFAETTQGASTIRIFGKQPTFMSRFSKLNDRYLNQRLKTTGKLLEFSMQMSFLTALLLLTTGLLGVVLAKNGLVSIGSIGVAFTFIILSGTSLQMFFEWFAQFEEAMTGVERLNDYLRRPLEDGAKLPAARTFPTIHPVYTINEETSVKSERLVKGRAAGMIVDNLWFRYAEDLPLVLKGLSFSIQSGEKIGIVGRTGSGKSSFIQALLHLYPFEKGSITIEGTGPKLSAGETATKTTDLSVFRRSLALISQEPTLFRGTLRENLDLANEHGDEELLEALRRVGMDGWLESLPKRLETEIEERGRNLSSGEKQLLCMARCLLQDAPIVVMDEATSSIDPQSEEILVRATREFFSDRTQIIIAHRLSTLTHCDRILWLHKGEIKLFDRPERVLPIFQAAEL